MGNKVKNHVGLVVDQLNAIEQQVEFDVLCGINDVSRYLLMGGGVLPDKMIRERVKITPFVDTCPADVVSYGLGHYGYDMRIDYDFRVFEPYHEVNSMTDEAAAWIAGIVDGEGSFDFNHGNGRKYLCLTVTNTDKETLDTVATITGVGQIYERNLTNDPNRKPTWDWKLTNARHVQELSVRILPYMVTKRVQALEVIQRMFKKAGMPKIDPKRMTEAAFTRVDAHDNVDEWGHHYCVIPPNSFALGVSVEHFEIPREVLAICLGKSTYARCGIVVPMTPLEPEWRGKVTLEISNTTPLPAKVYANEGIAQVIFLKGVRLCDVSYDDKKGKYQDQKGLTLPCVKSEPKPRILGGHA